MRNIKIVNESVEAWQIRPVFPQLYYAVRRFKGNNVSCLTYCNTGLDEKIKERLKSIKDILGNENTKIIDMILKTYGRSSLSELIELTHKHGTPWKKYYKKHSHGIIIPNFEIKQHYDDIISGNDIEKNSKK